MLWTAAEAAAATGGRAGGEWTASGVSIDSRTLVAGDLFVALKGSLRDGHDFIAQALAAGAPAAVCQRLPSGVPAAALLPVTDTMAALEDLGRSARARAGARVIAVTGSVGKTGTKEAIWLALTEQAPTFAAVSSLNNQWGVPLSLARLPREVAYAVFELGMNHAGEIRALTRQVRPDIAVVTAVEPVHLEYFASVEAIADAKAEIFEGMGLAGAAVLNRDNAYFDRLSAAARAQGLARVVGFGRDAAAEARLIDCRSGPAGNEVEADVLGERIHYRLAMPGEHWAMNSLAALAAVKLAGADAGAGAAALASMRPMKGRGQQLSVALAAGSFRLIDESYNANPAAMRAAIAVLGRVPPEEGGRRIAVLGDMRELGEAGARLHAELAPDLLAAKVDLVFTAGPLMAALAEALPKERRGGHAPDSGRLVSLVRQAVRAGDVVLVKGSLGSRMGPVVDALLALDGSPRPRAA